MCASLAPDATILLQQNHFPGLRVISNRQAVEVHAGGNLLPIARNAEPLIGMRSRG